MQGCPKFQAEAVDLIDEPNGLSLAVSSYNGEDILVHVLKPSHKSTLPSKMDASATDSVAPLLPTTNATRDVESEFETTQDGKIREIVVDNAELDPLNAGNQETGERLIATLKAEKENLEAALGKEQLLTLQLKQDLTEAEARNVDLTKASVCILRNCMN
ncbi:Acyl-CoA-binding domain-containing protein 4 [Nymphaea thermarum]|nr:Acyl-CoA-binding domain-containing protein 4 [Nymphaea thermarum]